MQVLGTVLSSMPLPCRLGPRAAPLPVLIAVLVVLVTIYAMFLFLNRVFLPGSTYAGLLPSNFATSLLRTDGFNVGAVDSNRPAAILSSSSFYVTLDVPKQCDGRRLGNQLFMVAALLYAAQMSGRQPIIADVSWNCLADFDRFFQEAVPLKASSSPSDTSVRSARNAPHLQRQLPPAMKTSSFDRSTILQNIFCPCFRFVERLAMDYDDRMLSMINGAEAKAARTVVLAGYFQSWRYADSVAVVLRRTLTFKPEVHLAASEFLDHVAPRGGFGTTSTTSSEYESAPALRIGIHARRGDMMTPYHISVGYEPPGSAFYHRALKYMVDHHRKRKLFFVVCSDDVEWAKENVRLDENSVHDDVKGLVKMAYCPNGQSAGHDLAVLSLCDHSIVSAGTFGWWAAWLANGTTVYYSNWPRSGSRLASKMHVADYYPPYWIPIE